MTALDRFEGKASTANDAKNGSVLHRGRGCRRRGIFRRALGPCVAETAANKHHPRDVRLVRVTPERQARISAANGKGRVAAGETADFGRFWHVMTAEPPRRRPSLGTPRIFEKVNTTTPRPPSFSRATPAYSSPPFAQEAFCARFAGVPVLLSIRQRFLTRSPPTTARRRRQS